jgi:hypothetical protein
MPQASVRYVQHPNGAKVTCVSTKVTHDATSKPPQLWETSSFSSEVKSALARCHPPHHHPLTWLLPSSFSTLANLYLNTPLGLQIQLIHNSGKMTVPTGKARANSPAGSDTSELTVPSRSPSPVPEYESFLADIRNNIFGPISYEFRASSATAVDEPETADQPRSPDGRFVSRRLRRARSPSPDRLVDIPSHVAEKSRIQYRGCLHGQTAPKRAYQTLEIVALTGC